jgi:hypothetical protein
MGNNGMSGMGGMNGGFGMSGRGGMTGGFGMNGVGAGSFMQQRPGSSFNQFGSPMGMGASQFGM